MESRPLAAGHKTPRDVPQGAAILNDRILFFVRNTDESQHVDSYLELRNRMTRGIAPRTQRLVISTESIGR